MDAGVSVGCERGARVVQAWCERGASEEVLSPHQIKQKRPTKRRRPDSISLSCSLGTDVRTQEPTEKKRELGQMDTRVYMWESACRIHRETDRDQVKEVLASGLPPKGLEACRSERGVRAWCKGGGSVVRAKRVCLPTK